ncbi:hypothetical protein G6F66_015070 [Rhizopus arrhizus]|nr:hypothetical protein G6F66_015070 [Rhizopus arrhizus]
MAYQPNTLKSFTPDSSTVGTSGIKALRALSATAMGRTLPDWISGSAPPTVANVASMRPPSSSVNARDSPLYGMCMMGMPVRSFSISIVKCAVEAFPADP